MAEDTKDTEQQATPDATEQQETAAPAAETQQEQAPETEQQDTEVAASKPEPKRNKYEQELVALELTAAIAIKGAIHKAGAVVELAESEAKSLLERGKAILAKL